MKSSYNDNQLVISAYYNLAIELARSNNPDDIKESIRLYDQILKLDPNYKNAWHGKGKAYSKLGETEKATHCFDEIMSKINSAIDSLQETFFAARDKSLEEKAKISEIVQQLKEIVKEEQWQYKKLR